MSIHFILIAKQKEHIAECSQVLGNNMQRDITYDLLKTEVPNTKYYFSTIIIDKNYRLYYHVEEGGI